MGLQPLWFGIKSSASKLALSVRASASPGRQPPP